MIKVSNLDVSFETPSETVEVLKGLDFSVAEGAAAAVVASVQFPDSTNNQRRPRS